jgi:hypothetical protein
MTSFCLNILTPHNPKRWIGSLSMIVDSIDPLPTKPEVPAARLCLHPRRADTLWFQTRDSRQPERHESSTCPQIMTYSPADISLQPPPRRGLFFWQMEKRATGLGACCTSRLELGVPAEKFLQSIEEDQIGPLVLGISELRGSKRGVFGLLPNESCGSPTAPS